MEQTSATQIDHAKQRYSGGYAYPAADRHRLRKAINLIGTGKRVLDVGSYDGQLSEQIMRAGNAVVAMDASAEALVAARGRKLETVLCDAATPWPLESASFDGVFAGEIIEHIIDTDFFLGECRRVLRPGGSLVLTTPNLASFGRRVMLLLGLNPMIDTALRRDQAGHIRYYVRRSLSTLLRENFFHVDVLQSDIVNFSNSLGSTMFADAFPNFGKSLIIRAIAPEGSNEQKSQAYT